MGEKTIRMKEQTVVMILDYLNGCPYGHVAKMIALIQHDIAVLNQAETLPPVSATPAKLEGDIIPADKAPHMKVQK